MLIVTEEVTPIHQPESFAGTFILTATSFLPPTTQVYLKQYFAPALSYPATNIKFTTLKKPKPKGHALCAEPMVVE